MKKGIENELKIKTEIGASLSPETKDKIEALLQKKQDHKALKAQKKKERYLRSPRGH